MTNVKTVNLQCKTVTFTFVSHLYVYYSNELASSEHW